MRRLIATRVSWATGGVLLLVAGCSDGGPVAPGGARIADVSPGVAEEDVDDPGSIQLPIKQQEGGPGIGTHDAPAPFVPGQAVVNVAEAAGVSLPILNARWSTTTLLELEDGQYALISVPPGQDAWNLCNEMLEAGDCDVAQPNYELEAPEVNQGVLAFVETGHIFTDIQDQSAFSRIGVPTAHLQSVGNGTIVAIVDTGVELTHPDLAGVLLAGWDFVDDDADPTDSADGIDQDADGQVDEGAGHGTHVAGIVHAVAPGARIIPVRVMDSDGVGNSVTVARGIRWAADNGADIINLSLGMRTDADVIKDAIDHADGLGVLVVASAGNEGIQESHHFPARESKVVAVAATDALDMKASFSNYGSYVNVSAPGEGILSTYLGGSYAVWSGTSFSTPMVSGGAALWYQKNPRGTPADATDAVEETAVTLTYTGLPYDGKMGEGRLDAAALAFTNGVGN